MNDENNMIPESYMRYTNEFEQVFSEIFHKAVNTDEAAVAKFVMEAFPDGYHLANFRGTRECEDQFAKLIASNAPFAASMMPVQISCWMFLDINENDALQNMLLNLFYIIEGKSHDDIVTEWQKIYSESQTDLYKIRNKRKKLIISKAHSLGYYTHLHIKDIYELQYPITNEKEPINVRNHIAHRSYVVKHEEKKIVLYSKYEGKSEKQMNKWDFFNSHTIVSKCQRNCVEIPYSEFLEDKFNLWMAFFNQFHEFYTHYSNYFLNKDFKITLDGETKIVPGNRIKLR